MGSMHFTLKSSTIEKLFCDKAVKSSALQLNYGKGQTVQVQFISALTFVFTVGLHVQRFPES